MATKDFTKKLMPTAAAVTLAHATTASGEQPVEGLILKIKSPNDDVRGPAWQSATQFGAAAVKPLADVFTHADMEIARAAKRALWLIIRHAGRPGAGLEQKAVASELILLLTRDNSDNCREVLWMLSEIGGDETVEPVAALLANEELREDARAVLERIPGRKSLAALKSALANAPADFRPAIAVSLRARGEKIPGYPSRKLVPTKKTGVKPAVAKA